LRLGAIGLPDLPSFHGKFPFIHLSGFIDSSLMNAETATNLAGCSAKNLTEWMPWEVPRHGGAVRGVSMMFTAWLKRLTAGRVR
jgi:hypothetical protein